MIKKIATVLILSFIMLSATSVYAIHIIRGNVESVDKENQTVTIKVDPKTKLEKTTKGMRINMTVYDKKPLKQVKKPAKNK